MRLKSRRAGLSVRGWRVACLSRKARLRQPRMFERLEPKRLLAAIQTWQVRGAGGGGARLLPQLQPRQSPRNLPGLRHGPVVSHDERCAAWDTVDFRQIYGGPNSAVEFTSNPQIDYSVDYASGGDDVAPAAKAPMAASRGVRSRRIPREAARIPWQPTTTIPTAS